MKYKFKKKEAQIDRRALQTREAQDKFLTALSCHVQDYTVVAEGRCKLRYRKIPRQYR